MKEFKIAMLGMTEGNGHPYSWSAMFNGYNKEAMEDCGFPVIPRYLEKQPKETFGVRGAKVTHVWCDDPENAKKVSKASLIPNILEKPEDCIGQVDAVIIATDQGWDHVERAEKFIEAGIPVFIDTEAESWNMDPVALEKAFEMYPDVKLVVSAELYGFPGRMDIIKGICEKHGALLIEDAAEAMGATIHGRQCGSFGDYSAISYNGNKIITGSAGGCLLTNDIEVANKARKWSTQARENAPWYQHEEVGYNYRMSNVIAGVVRGQYPYLEEHIARKKAIYERYHDGFKDLPVQMNPIMDGTEPNYWLSAMIIDKNHMCKQVRDDSKALYIKEPGKTCPTEILETLASYNAEGRPIWKPMHMQPMYRMHEFVTREGSGRCRTNAYIAGGCMDIGADIFERGLCLPSDNKMTDEEQDKVIEIIRSCFN